MKKSRRAALVSFRVTSVAKEAMEKAAAAQGVRLSVWLRNLAKEAINTPQDNTEPLYDDWQEDGEDSGEIPFNE